ncbi:MAG: hypothetical protein V3T72_02195 [Thermoanaerobaculia bacterium]
MSTRPACATSTLTLGFLLLLPGTNLGAAEGSDPVLVTPHFAFYSDLATNLNDALLVAGSARNADRPELFHTGEGKDCFEALAPSARLGWNLSVDWYAEIVSPADWNDRRLRLIRVDLAGAGDYLESDERAQRYLGIAHAFQAAATPAYEECHWSAQEAQNRAWIEALAPRLAAHEATIAPRLAEHYRVKWHGLPIRIDAVETSPSLGASTIILSPAGGHVLISTSSLEGERAFETVFHEASHTLVAPWRPDPVPKALADAAEEVGVALVPRDLWHVVLFYTTGQVVRQALEAAGHPGYTPYLFAFDRFGRGDWGRARDALEETWPAYMAGERTLEEAAAHLLQSLSQSEKDPAGSDR